MDESMNTTRAVLYASLWVTLAIAGCREQQEPTKVPIALTERQALAAPPSQLLALGADCSATLSAGCQSKLCLKTVDGAFCSKPCTGPSDCSLSGWSCNQVYPEAGGWLCVPGRRLSGVAGDGGSP